MKTGEGKSAMKVKKWLCSMLVLSMVYNTGCWDRIEVNDILLIMGTAFDLAPDGNIEMTVQVMLPSQGGTSGSGQGSSGEAQKESYFVESASGIEPGEGLAKLQKKFPRRLFRGHRRVIIIGEDMARQGIGVILDSLSRDPGNRLRTHILVAKGRKGKDLLKMDYPMERIPTEAMREMERSGFAPEITIRDFLISSSAEGMDPIAAVIEPSGDKNIFELTGTAIFKHDRLIGYLSAKDTVGYQWITGKSTRGTISTSIPGIEGEISVDIGKVKPEIQPIVTGDKVRFDVKLSSEGVIYGSGTNLDFTLPKNIELAEEAVKAYIKKQALQTIKTVQEVYGADIFGFGNLIHQKQPDKWKQLKDKWDEFFPEAEISVSLDFNIRRTGMSGPPLHLNESEVKK